MNYYKNGSFKSIIDRSAVINRTYIGKFE